MVHGTLAGTVTLNLNEVSLRTALDAVTRATGTEWRAEARLLHFYGPDAPAAYDATYRVLRGDPERVAAWVARRLGTRAVRRPRGR